MNVPQVSHLAVAEGLLSKTPLNESRRFTDCAKSPRPAALNTIAKKIRIVLRYGFLYLLKSIINERALQVSLEQPEERNPLRVQD